MPDATPRASQQVELPCDSAMHHNRVTVAILMCTYNGARFLAEQLDSILQQRFKNWTLYISDDGSTDATLEILKGYQARLEPGRLLMFNGPQQGFGQNFLSLLKRPEVNADFFAFCDQDDVWLEDKLTRSISALQHVAPSRPALYCSRTRTVDVSNSYLGLSPLFTRQPSFRNALVQSIAGANTMLVNSRARSIMCQIGTHTPVVAHDWLAYLSVSAAGGEVTYDPKPSLNYRQHHGNLIGANATLRSRLYRLTQMFGGRFRQWTDQNLVALGEIEHCMTEENLSTLRIFREARLSRLARRLALMGKVRPYRQTPSGNLSLAVAIVMNKI